MKKLLSILTSVSLIIILFIQCGDDAHNGNAQKTTTAHNASTSESKVSEYEKIRARYIDFSFGDLPHYIFKTTDGEKEVDFAQNKDNKIALEIDDAHADQGIGINTAMKGKIFDVYYKNEKITPAGWDEDDAMDGMIIYRLEEVNE